MLARGMLARARRYANLRVWAVCRISALPHTIESLISFSLRNAGMSAGTP